MSIRRLAVASASTLSLLACTPSTPSNTPPAASGTAAATAAATATATATAAASATATASANAATSAPTIAKQWTGRISLAFDKPGGKPKPPKPQVITDQAGYDAFVANIPKKTITKKSPAPPSNDPLLKKPPIDFSKHVLVVAARGDTMYASPKIALAVTGGKLVITVTHPPDEGMGAQAMGIGSYRAVLIDKPTMPVEFVEPGAK